MNLKTSLKYKLKDNLRSIIVYYFVILCVICLIAVSVIVPDSNAKSNIIGMEMATVIFLFVVGLNSFKENFLMLLQNGSSRKTIFTSGVLSMFIISTGMAIIDFIILAVIKLAAGNIKSLKVMGLFEMNYSRHVENIGSFQAHTESLIFQILMYLAFVLVGYFITIAYYRMNKAAKTAVSIGVPVGLFFILPLIDETLMKGRVSDWINDLFNYAFGLHSQNPCHAMVTFLLLSVVFAALSWLLMRRAVVKNQ